MDSLFAPAPAPSGARHDLLGSAALPHASIPPPFHPGSSAPAATAMSWSRAEALDDFLAKTMDRLMEPMAKEFAARLAASDPKPPATATTSPLLIHPVSNPSPDIAVGVGGQPYYPPVGLWYNEIWQKILERNFDSNNAADVAVTTQAWKSLSAANLTEQTVEAAVRPILAVTQESANDISQAFQDIGGRPATAAETGMVEGWEASPSIAGSLDATRWWLANQGAGGFDGIDVTDKVLQDYSDILQRAPSLPGQVPAGQTDELDAARLYIKDHTTPAFRVSLATGTESTSDLTNTFNQVLGRPPNATDYSVWQNYLGSAPGNTLANIREFIAKWGGATNECATAINNAFLAVLNRPASATDISGWQSNLGAGSSLTDLRTAAAQSTEAVNDIQAAYQAVFGRAAQGWEVSTVQGWLINGQQTMAGLRPSLTTDPECVTDIKGMYQSLFDRQPSNTELSWAQGQLAGAQTLAQLRQSLATDAEEVTDLTNLYWNIVGRAPDQPGLQGWEGVLASGQSLNQVRQQAAQSPEAVGDVTNEYLTILGRTPSNAELTNAETVLGNGTQTLAGLRSNLAYAAEAISGYQSAYNMLLGRSASGDEVTGLEQALAYAPSGDPSFTLSGQPGVFATGDARQLLPELAVYVSLNSGVTPTLKNASGTTIGFADATQLAGFLFGTAIRAGTADPLLVSDYSLTVNWLTQINQPELQAAEGYVQMALAAKSAGNTYLSALYTTAARIDLAISTAVQAGQAPPKLLAAGLQFIAAGNAAAAQANWNLVALVQAGADICLQESQMPNLASLGPYTERVYQANGATTVDVTVDPHSSDPFGTATYHSKDQSPSLLLPILTAVLDVVAIVTGQPWLLAAASALNAGESANNFAHGNILAGVLDLGAAAGFGLESAGAFGQAAAEAAGATEDAAASATTVLPDLTAGQALTLGDEVLETTAFVGGLSGIAQGAQQNNPFAIAAGALETVAAIASGIITTGNAGDDKTFLQWTVAISAIAGGAVGAAGAIRNGDIADGLIQSLGPLLTLVGQNASAIVGSEQAPTPYQVADAGNIRVDVGITAAPPSADTSLAGQVVQYVNPLTNTVQTGTIASVDANGGVTLTSGGYYGSAYITSIGTLGTAGLAAAGVGSEVAALQASALALRAASIPALTVPVFGEGAAAFLATTSALIQLYSLSLTLRTTFVVPLPEINGQAVLDVSDRIVTIEHLTSTGAPVGDTVQLAATDDGTLHDANGIYAGIWAKDGALQIAPTYAALYQAGDVGYVGDTATVWQATKLNANLKATGIQPPSTGGPYDAHHIVPGGGPLSGGRDASRAQNILKAAGISLDDARNGVWLPKWFHEALHRAGYYNYINTNVIRIGPNATALQQFLSSTASYLVKEANLGVPPIQIFP